MARLLSQLTSLLRLLILVIGMAQLALPAAAAGSPFQLEPGLGHPAARSAGKVLAAVTVSQLTVLRPHKPGGAPPLPAVLPGAPEARLPPAAPLALAWAAAPPLPRRLHALPPQARAPPHA